MHPKPGRRRCSTTRFIPTASPTMPGTTMKAFASQSLIARAARSARSAGRPNWIRIGFGGSRGGSARLRRRRAGQSGGNLGGWVCTRLGEISWSTRRGGFTHRQPNCGYRLQGQVILVRKSSITIRDFRILAHVPEKVSRKKSLRANGTLPREPASAGRRRIRFTSVRCRASFRSTRKSPHRRRYR